MKSATLHNLADYKPSENLPPNPEIGGKSVSATVEGGNPQFSQFAGDSANSTILKTTLPLATGGKHKHAGGKGKSPAKSTPKSHVPTVEPTAGPNGHKVDCAKVASKEWTLEKLKSAYPSEAMSWKKSKERAAKLDMNWDPAWSRFDAFLLDMGPKADPDQTLDRTDPALKAYGLGLCRWLSKAGQANNKTNNIKIYDPHAKTHFSSQQLATVHNVPVEKIHKWSAAGWTPLEMLVGKKDTLLVWIATQVPDLFKPPASNVSIKNLPNDTPAPPPALRLPLTFLSNVKMPDMDRDDPCDYDPETGEAGPASALFLKKCGELRALRAWHDAWNAGEPCTLYPPQSTTFKLTADMTAYVRAVAGKPWTPTTPMPVVQAKTAVPTVTAAPAKPDADYDDDDDDDAAAD